MGFEKRQKIPKFSKKFKDATCSEELRSKKEKEQKKRVAYKEKQKCNSTLASDD